MTPSLMALAQTNSAEAGPSAGRERGREGREEVDWRARASKWASYKAAPLLAPPSRPPYPSPSRPTQVQLPGNLREGDAGIGKGDFPQAGLDHVVA